MAESWESLKSRAKGLKSELDTKMQELGRLNKRLGTAGSSSASSSTGGASGGRVAALDGQIQIVVSLRDEVESGLRQLEEATESLARIGSTSTQAAQAARFRETHQEMSMDFKRVAASIEHQYQHARLLPKTHGKSTGGAGGGPGTEQEGLFAERNGLNSSLSMCDDVIGQAMATRDMVSNQNRTLRDTRGKMGAIESIMPGVAQMIGKITDRKNKETVVLSLTVACCCFFTIWYKFL